jgi:membrane associated rhomboid family serine protease
MFKQLRIIKHMLKIPDRVPHRPLTGLIIAMCVVFALQVALPRSCENMGMMVSRDVAAAWASISNGHVTAGNVSTMLTAVSAVFLHADASHLLSNMLFLWIFGALVSSLLGEWRTLALFLVCGIAGSVGHFMTGPGSANPYLGASGAIVGLEGIYLVLALRWRLPWPSVWPLARPIAPLQLAILTVVGVAFDLHSLASRAQTGIAYGAHLGGFVAGIILAAIIAEIGNRRSRAE